MADIVDWLLGLIWSNWLVGLILIAAVWFTIRLRAVQFRRIPDMFRLMVHGRSSDAGVSSFQSLSMSLANRVGMGNIGGVATAIAFGGPGALFWMWAVALLGAATSFIECTLGQIYKERDHTGKYRGGPAFYIEKGMGQRWFGLLFAGVAVVAMILLPTVQANGISSAMNTAWNLNPWIVAVGVVIVVAFIIVGGVKRIASFAAAVVPFMAVGYILLALVVIGANASEVPAMFGLIFRSAFGLDATFGAMIGLAIQWGVQRGVYSNEAGQGNGPHHAAAAEVSHPAKQGLVQAAAVYIDTLLVCSATGLMILSTGMYRVFEGGSADGAVIFVGNDAVAEAEAGPAFTQAALNSLFSGLGATFVAIALLFFALTTLIAYYYIAETNFTYLVRRSSNPRVQAVGIRFVQLAILIAAAWGSVASGSEAWALGDIAVGMMAWLNIIAILILQQPAVKTLADYDRQRRQGKDPEFDPVAAGVKNATFWEERQRVKDPA
jgi:alanine or glycine:cation symporter, AGCS family